MKRSLILGIVLTAWLLAGAAQATAYPVMAYDPNHHAMWIPGLGESHLLLDPGATLTVEPTEWNLVGNLTSADNGSMWSLSVDFTGVLTGPEFGLLTGFDDDRIKGADWSDIHADWAFAEFVTGTLSALTGAHAGREFSLSRMPGSQNYFAQFGTCLNDKNCDKGLSTWLNVTGNATGETFRGDINVKVANPVPEPGAGPVFGVGLLVIATAIRRRRA